MNIKIDKAKRRRDERGFLVDFLKADELIAEDQTFGQMYFVSFEKPKMIRGNHYHKTKKEWYVAAYGKLQVEMEDVRTKEHKSFILDGDNDEYERMCIGPDIAHAFKNLTPTAMMVNYCNKPYHHDKPDTVKYILIK